MDSREGGAGSTGKRTFGHRLGRLRSEQAVVVTVLMVAAGLGGALLSWHGTSDPRPTSTATAAVSRVTESAPQALIGSHLLPRAPPTVSPPSPQGPPDLPINNGGPATTAATSSADPSAGSTGAAWYALTFSETGLPAGTVWWVSIQSSATGHLDNWSDTSSIVFFVGDGTYSFWILHIAASSAFYVPLPSSGNVSVSGAPASVQVAYTGIPYYWLEFTETGLPLSTPWMVEADSSLGGWGNQSTNSTIGLRVPMGSYSFEVPWTWNGSTLYSSTPSSGNVTVSGPGVTVDVAFTAPRLYRVTFDERGLPAGQVWWAVIPVSAGLSIESWPGSFNNSTGSSLDIRVPNGTWTFQVGVETPGSWYAAWPARGNVTVNGSEVTVEEHFLLAWIPPLWMTFTEHGLPAGTPWGVGLYCASSHCLVSGTMSLNNSTSASIGLRVWPYSAYAFVVSYALNGSTLYVPAPQFGNLTLKGAGGTENVTFTGVPLYELTFSETGLPSGTTWFVNVSGPLSGSLSGSGSTLSTWVTNGSYTYSVGVPDPRWVPAPSAGAFIVNGTAVTVPPVRFTMPKFTVSFMETGIPAKKLLRHGWTVVLNGTSEHGTTPTITFNGMPRGTMPVFVQGPTGWRATGSGSVRVTGPTTVAVTMARGNTVSLKFQERGLHAGTSWCVTVDGYSQCTRGKNLKFAGIVPSLSYNYSVGTVAGYTATATIGKAPQPVSGSLSMTKATTVKVHFTR